MNGIRGARVIGEGLEHARARRAGTGRPGMRPPARGARRRRPLLEPALAVGQLAVELVAEQRAGQLVEHGLELRVLLG